MMPPPISEDDLQAWADEQLPPQRQAEVAAYLAREPAAAARLADYRAHNRALRAQFAAILGEPLPPRLQAAAAGSGQRRLPAAWERWAWQPLGRLAAGLLLALGGAAGGWMAHGLSQAPLSLSTLPHQAAVAHAVFAPDLRRPVEVGADQEAQLVAWLSKRLGTALRPPRLGDLGYTLVGGRLLPGSSGPVAQFMYQDAASQRLTLYISRESRTPRASAFRFAQEGRLNVFYWVDGDFGYALAAEIDRGTLAPIATSVYHQLEQP